jgi:hypothetical protein
LDLFRIGEAIRRTPAASSSTGTLERLSKRCEEFDPVASRHAGSNDLDLDQRLGIEQRRHAEQGRRGLGVTEELATTGARMVGSGSQAFIENPMMSSYGRRADRPSLDGVAS